MCVDFSLPTIVTINMTVMRKAKIKMHVTILVPSRLVNGGLDKVCDVGFQMQIINLD